MLRSLPTTINVPTQPVVSSIVTSPLPSSSMEHGAPISLPSLTTSSPVAALSTLSPTPPSSGNGNSVSSPTEVAVVDEGPQINWFGTKPLRWGDVEEVILKRLYPTSSRMTVSVLAGGFSSGTVLAIRSYDQSDVREVATVVKIDTKALIAQEFKAIKRVKEILGNAAPQIIDCVDSLGPPGGEKGGIKFRYGVVNAGRRKPKRLLDLFEELTPQSLESILQVINEIYCDLLDPWHSAAKPEFFPLYAYYFEGFDQNNGEGKKFSQVWVDPNYLKRFITYAMSGKGTDPALHYKKTKGFLADYEPYNDETFMLPGCDQRFANIGHLFERPDGVPYLKTIPPVRLYSSYAHGDANLQNFLHDERGNVWVVDFLYTTNKQHVLRDPCKMWACIMFVATEIATDKQFAQAVLISRTLARARDLHQPLPEAIGITNMHLQYIYKILLCLWGHLGRIVKDRSHATQFQLGLVSECMRFFLYECRNTYCKRWALVTAILLMESVLAQTKRVHDIRPDWITVPNSLCKGKLGMTRCPGNKHYSRIKPSSVPPLATPGPGSSVTGNNNNINMSNNGSGNGNGTTGRPLSVNAPTPSSSHRDNHGHGHKGNRPRLKSTEEYMEDEDAAAAMIATNDEGKIPLEHAVLPPMSIPTNSIPSSPAPSLSSISSPVPLSSPIPSSSAAAAATSSVSTIRPPLLGNTGQRISPPQPLTLGVRTVSDDGTIRGTPLSSSSLPQSSISIANNIGNRSSPTLSTLPGHPQSPMSPIIGHDSQHATLSPSPVSIPAPVTVPGVAVSVSMTMPERKRPNKLEREVAKLKEVGVTHTLFLVHDSEFADMGLSKQGVQLAVDNAGISQTFVAVPPGEIRMAHAIQVVKLSIRILCERPENKLAIITKSGKHRAGVLAACILCAFGCSPKDAINMVRATRGASAIGRGAREQVIAKFDLAWKNHIIAQILMEDDSMLDRRIVTSGPDPPYQSTINTTSNATSITSGTSGNGNGNGNIIMDDGSGKGQDWTPEGEERAAMRRDYHDPTKFSRSSLNVFEERKAGGSVAPPNGNGNGNGNGIIVATGTVTNPINNTLVGASRLPSSASASSSTSMASPVKGNK